MGVTAAPHTLAGWTPVGVDWERGRRVIRWCYTDGVEFTDPFFDQTIERCLQDPFRLLFWRETEVGSLAEFASQSPGLEPDGFIFHLSRCGSTLLAQMFAGLSTALVISEPGPIDAVLRASSTHPGPGDGEALDWLRWIVSALGQRRRDEQTRLVIKLDAWAILQLPLIRAAFPDAACVFVYRNPLEVMVSHLGHRGYHMIPGTLPSAWFGLSARQARAASAERYFAAVLARLCQAALDGARGGHLALVEYESLPEAVPETIAPLFGIEVGSLEEAVFAGVAERDAKNPAVAFVADSVEKQRRATAAARAAVETWVDPVYESLDALRQGRP